MSSRRTLASNSTLLLLIILATLSRHALSDTSRAGEDIFAVDRGRVLEVQYRSATRRMIAYRWDVHQNFTVFFTQKNDPAPHLCPAGKGFDIVLQQLSSLKSKRPTDEKTLEESAKTDPGAWAEILIRDDSEEVEPFQTRILPVKGSPTEALIRVQGSTYVVGVEHRVFDLISKGCKALSSH